MLSRADHCAHAAEAGMKLRPTQVLFFGKPSRGTWLTQAEQTVALDLPSRALAWRDTDRGVGIGYRSPRVIVTDSPKLERARAAVEDLADAIDRASDAAVTS